MSPDLRQLRERIARMETGGGARRHPPLTPGFPAVAAALPGGGLARGGVHEVMFPPSADGAGNGPATGFALHLLTRLAASAPERFFLWAGCRDDLYGPGLAAAGLDPGRVLFARGTAMTDVLWAVEEGLRCPDLAAVAADVAPLDFALTRRLSLAAADSGVLLLLLQPAPRPQRTASQMRTASADSPAVSSVASFADSSLGSPGPLRPSAALTRWFVAAAPGGRWRLDLLRCRGGQPHAWLADPATGETWPAADPAAPTDGQADGPADGPAERAEKPPAPESESEAETESGMESLASTGLSGDAAQAA